MNNLCQSSEISDLLHVGEGDQKWDFQRLGWVVCNSDTAYTDYQNSTVTLFSKFDKNGEDNVVANVISVYLLPTDAQFYKCACHHSAMPPSASYEYYSDALSWNSHILVVMLKLTRRGRLQQALEQRLMIGDPDSSIANDNRDLLMLQRKARFPFKRNRLRCVR